MPLTSEDRFAIADLVALHGHLFDEGGLDRNPVAHHVTNIVITPVNDDIASVRSKWIGVTSDGKCGSATYLDTVTRTPVGWRISQRHLQARRQPLNGLGTKLP